MGGGEGENKILERGGGRDTERERRIASSLGREEVRWKIKRSLRHKLIILKHAFTRHDSIGVIQLSLTVLLPFDPFSFITAARGPPVTAGTVELPVHVFTLRAIAVRVIVFPWSVLITLCPTALVAVAIGVPVLPVAVALAVFKLALIVTRFSPPIFRMAVKLPIFVFTIGMTPIGERIFPWPMHLSVFPETIITAVICPEESAKTV